MQEFITYLQTKTFERRKPEGVGQKLVGDAVKKYCLAPKSIENIVGLVKLIVGKKVSRSWELDLPTPDTRARQRYFSKQEMDAICELAEGQFKVLFHLLKGTAMRIAEACGLCVEHLEMPEKGEGIVFVRQSFSETASRMLDPKTRKPRCGEAHTQMLRKHLADTESKDRPGVSCGQRTSTSSRKHHQARAQSDPAQARYRNRRQSQSCFPAWPGTVLRKNGVSEEAILQWIGHTETRTTDGYSHVDEDLEFRRRELAKVM